MGKKLSDFFRGSLIKGDIGIWMIYFLLCMVSIVVIYSASSQMSFKTLNHWKPLLEQLAFLIVGFLIVVFVSKIPCKYFKLFPIVGLPVVVILLIYTLFLQRGVNEAARWIDIFGISFQPSEVAKTVLIMEVAVLLSKMQREEIVKTKHGEKRMIRATKGGHSKAFKTVGLISLLVCGLILPENFSTALMLLMVVIVMMFIGNVPLDLMGKALIGFLVVAALLMALLLLLPESSLSGMKRAVTWKHRIESQFGLYEEDKTSQEYQDKVRQVNCSKVAIASSGITGIGVGNSEMRDFLPHAESDFIYSIIIEETGVFGAALILLLFIMLLVRVGRVAQQCDKFFPAFLVIGLGLIMVVQALVNMAVAVNLIPVTGQTLPLISHGGTSILIVSFNFGVIISVSRYAELVSKQQKEENVAFESAEMGSSQGLT